MSESGRQLMDSVLSVYLCVCVRARAWVRAVRLCFTEAIMKVVCMVDVIRSTKVLLLNKEQTNRSKL